MPRSARGVEDITAETFTDSAPDGGLAPDRYREGRVENGKAYERAALRLTGYTRLVAPRGAAITRGAAPDALRLAIEKSLHFMGHPPADIGLGDLKRNMGVAFSEEGDALVLATYGEFDTKEGGASLALSIEAPPGLKVERRDDLSGRKSAAAGALALTPKTHWYGSNRPAAGWTALAAAPAPKPPAPASVLRERGGEERQAHVVAVRDVHMAVVELLVPRREAGAAHPRHEGPRAPDQPELVAGAAVDIDQL
jgi:hypothetical protein